MPSRQIIIALLLCVLFCTLVGGQKFAYGQAGAWDDSLFPLERKGKWGFTDEDGTIVIAPAFDSIHTFSEGMAAVKVKGKWGFINSRGKMVIPPQYEIVENFSQGLAKVKRKKKWGAINKTGKVVIKPKFDYIKDFHDGLAGALINGKWGFIDQSGKIVIKPKFDIMRDVKDGLAAIRLGEKWGFVDEKGSIVIEPRFDYVLDFQAGLAIITIGGNCRQYKRCAGGNWGLVDKQGTIVIEPRFDYIGLFSEGLASISLNGKWGFIDKTGAIVIKPEYTKVTDFRHGVSSVQQDDIWGFIDKSGAFTRGFRRNHYTGYVGKQSGVSWELAMEVKTLSGTSLSDDREKPLFLKGTMDTPTAFTITGSDAESAQSAGRFIGTFSPDFRTMGGEWFPPGGKKNVPFGFRLKAEYRELVSENHNLYFQYPHFLFNNPGMQKQVNVLLLTRVAKELDRIVMDIKKGAREQNLYVYEQYELEHIAGNHISILFIRKYPGGDHPSPTHTAFNLWLKPDTVVPLALPDLFQPGALYVKTIADLCTAEVKKLSGRNIPNNSTRSLFKKNRVVFTLTRQGLQFFFAASDFGLKSEETYAVVVPYAAVASFINPEGPLTQFARK